MMPMAYDNRFTRIGTDRNHLTNAKKIGSLSLISLDHALASGLAEEQGGCKTRTSIGFLKIDVEGLEAAVIRGVTKLLQGGGGW